MPVARNRINAGISFLLSQPLGGEPPATDRKYVSLPSFFFFNGSCCIVQVRNNFRNYVNHTFFVERTMSEHRIQKFPRPSSCILEFIACKFD